MSRTYIPISDSLSISRDDDGYSSPVQILLDRYATNLNTDQVGKMAASLALIYFRRTGKVPMPPASTPFATVEFASDVVDENGASLPRCQKCGSQSGDDWSQCGGECPMPMSPHYAKPDKEASCAFCLDECTGECL